MAEDQGPLRIPKDMLGGPWDQTHFHKLSRHYLPFSFSFSPECSVEFSRGYMAHDTTNDRVQKQVPGSSHLLLRQTRKRFAKNIKQCHSSQFVFVLENIAIYICYFHGRITYVFTGIFKKELICSCRKLLYLGDSPGSPPFGVSHL